jgi:alpha-mannosidase
MAQEFRFGQVDAGMGKRNEGGDLPPEFGFLQCEPGSVVVTALYRESSYSGKSMPTYASAQPDFDNDYPHVLRLVEFDGLESDVILTIAGTVRKVFKTNLLGEVCQELRATLGDGASTMRFRMRPHEIATLYLDIEEGRKRPRDLDAARHVWATVHRTEDNR